MYAVSKIKGNYDRGLTNEQVEKCKINTKVIEDEDCITQVIGGRLSRSDGAGGPKRFNMIYSEPRGK